MTENVPVVTFHDEQNRLLGSVLAERRGWHKIPPAILVRMLKYEDDMPSILARIDRNEVTGVFRVIQGIQGEWGLEMEAVLTPEADDRIRNSELAFGGTVAHVVAAVQHRMAGEAHVASDASVIRAGSPAPEPSPGRQPAVIEGHAMDLDKARQHAGTARPEREN
jgi:hypothetical protein